MKKHPSDWIECTLGEISKLSSGGTPDRKNNTFWNGSIPWINTSQISFNKITSPHEYITDLGLKSSAAKILPVNTILMAMYGQGRTRGRVAILGIEAATNQACAAILVNQNHDFRYVYYYLQYCYTKIRNLGHGGNQKNLNQEIIANISIILPPLAEQRKISDILSLWDNTILCAERLVEILKIRKSVLMKILLTGERRFGKTKDIPRSKKTLFGYIPIDWTSTTLGEIFNMSSGATPSRKILNNFYGSNLWVTSGELNYNVILDTKEKISDSAIRDTRLQIYPKGTFLLAITGLEALGTRGRCAILGVPAAINQSCMAFDSSDTVNTKYLFYYYNLFSDKIATRYAQGTKQQSLPKKIIDITPFFFPSRTEQDIITQILDFISEEIALIQEKIKLMNLQKRGLMQQLLTGKTRVSLDDSVL